MDNKDVISIIKSFLDGTAKDWEWDDFISVPIKNDPFLEEIRKRCVSLPDEFPPAKGKGYCNKEGIEVLKKYIHKLEERLNNKK